MSLLVQKQLLPCVTAWLPLQEILKLCNRALSVHSKEDVGCPPCGEAGIKHWGSSCRACLYMEVRCRGLAVRPGQCWKLPGWLCSWPEVKMQEVMLKPALVLLPSGISVATS